MCRLAENGLSFNVDAGDDDEDGMDSWIHLGEERPDAENMRKAPLAGQRDIWPANRREWETAPVFLALIAEKRGLWFALSTAHLLREEG